MSEQDKEELAQRVNDYLIKTRQFKNKEISLEEFFLTFSLTQVIQSKVLTQVIYSCEQKIDDLQTQLNKFESSDDR